MKFIDSNILVYLADRHDDDKREIAKGVVADAMRYPEGYLNGTVSCVEIDWFRRGDKRHELKFQTMWKEKPEGAK